MKRLLAAILVLIAAGCSSKPCVDGERTSSSSYYGFGGAVRTSPASAGINGRCYRAAPSIGRPSARVRVGRMVHAHAAQLDNVVEQSNRAVPEVLSGIPVVEVAERN